MRDVRAVLATALPVALLLAGCLDVLPPPGGTSWDVTYLGDDVEKRAIDLEDDEVRRRFPDLVEAMEEARKRGVNATVDALHGDELGPFLSSEVREQWSGAGGGQGSVYDRYRQRVNWTGSTFRLSASVG